MRITGVLKKWWFWAAVVAVVVVAFLVLRSGGNGVEYVTQITEKSELVQTVDANGEVVSIDEVDLSFDVSGTVQQLLVEVGDVVEVDTLLAVLDSSELIANVQSAFQSVKVAQGNLEAQKAGSSDETLAISERALDVSKASLSVSQIDYDNKLSLIGLVEDRYEADTDAQSAALEAAADNLDQTISNNANSIADSYDDLLSSAWAGVIEVRSAVGRADEILGVRNGTLNDDYQLFLGSGNPSAKANALSLFSQTEGSRDDAETRLLAANYGSSGAIVLAADDVEDAMDDGAALLLYVRQAIETMPASGDLSVSELSALLASVDASRNALQLDQAALQNAFQAVQGALHDANANLEDSQNALAQAQATFDSSEANKNYQVTSATQAVSTALAMLDQRGSEVAQALASLTQVAAEPRVVDLASYEAEVSRAQAAYKSAQARLSKAEITSPIVGSVTDISIKTGEQVVATSPIITVQTTREQFEVAADVSESDIAKVSLDDSVLLTFDAFGLGVEVNGVVREIDLAEKMVEGVVFYEVTIQIDEMEQSLALRPGLSADLILTTDMRNDAIVVPQRAVFERDDLSYVRVLEKGDAVERRVEVGLRGDLGKVEIISGLEEGEELVIREIVE
jgi:membrane fusion protein, macrolide-specific efflux system